MEKVYRTDLDYSIIDKPNLSDAELLRYIEDNFFDYKGGPWKLDKIYQFVKIICRLEKVQPSIEQFIYILCNKDRLLNEACAGAGKTTMSKYRMLIANACYGIPGNQILAIAYNQHAARDIEEKYQLSVRRINDELRPKRNAKQAPNQRSKGSSAFHLDSDIKCSTFHSWCLTWVTEYRSRYKVITSTKLDLLDESKEIQFMRSVLERFLKKHERKDVYLNDSMVTNLIALNNWIRETLTEEDPQAWFISSTRTDLGMFSPTDLNEIFANYKMFKRLSMKFDYQDLVMYMYELLCDPTVINRVRSVYRYIVIDEYQDITPSMLRIIKLLFEGDESLGIPRFDDGTLVCIGDGDQSIYGFRGTDSENCIRFKQDYPNGIITAMSINRRCDAKILDYARRIIESNTNRILKPIRGLHDGGNVLVRFYNDEVDEITQLIDYLRGVPNLRRTCICYRNLLSSQFLVVKLLESGIPFNTKRGLEPYSDMYSRSIEDLFYLLEHPTNLDYARKTIYKFVPRGPGFTKEKLKEIYDKHEKELKNSRRGDYVQPKSFWEHDFSEWGTQRGFKEALVNLYKAHIAIKKNEKMSIFMPDILNQLKKYYIDALRKSFLSDKLGDAYIRFIERHYSQNFDYKSFRKEQTRLLDNLRKNKESGCVITTMHGLKGLEFDNVIVIDLEDNLYPGNELKNNNLSEAQREKIEWEARRLLYVTVTRAKHNLLMYFKQTGPSRYLKFFLESDDLNTMYQRADINLTGSNSFINKAQTMQTLSVNVSDDDNEFIIEDDFTPNDNNALSVINDSDNDEDDFNELFGNIEAEFDSIDDDDDDGDDMFDDVESLTVDDDTRPASELPWAEDENNPNYKPKIGTMLQILRSKGAIEGDVE